MKKRAQWLHNNKGLTLTELMVAILILLPLFVGALYTFLKCNQLNELTLNSSNALWACNNKLAEIEDQPYNQIFANYNGTTFTENSITNGIGVSYVDNTDPNSLEITVVYNWRESNGNLIGEDANLNGQIDAGEDTNNNGILDSMVQITTIINQI